MINKKLKPVTICIPKNEAEHLVITSILRSAGIEYFAKNYHIQNLFGVGQVGGNNLIVGAIEIQVSPKHRQYAQLILKEMAQYGDRGFNLIPGSDRLSDGSESSPLISENVETDLQKSFTRLANKSAIFSILWLGGIGSIFAVQFGLEAFKLIKGRKYKLKGKAKALYGLVMGLVQLFCCYPFLNALLG